MVKIADFHWKLMLVVSIIAIGCSGAASESSPVSSPSGVASSTPIASTPEVPSDALALFPPPPEDPADSCELFDALIQSADDLVVFGELILAGTNRDAAAQAADAYALAADDWDELALELVVKYPGTLDPQSAAYAVEALKWGATVPQAVDFLARVIRGTETSQTLEEAATAFANPGSYSTLEPMRGFEGALCGVR